MPHPSHGNISNCPVILSRNKVHNPPVPCPISCFLKLPHTPQNTGRTGFVSLWHFLGIQDEPILYLGRKTRRDIMQRETLQCHSRAPSHAEPLVEMGMCMFSSLCTCTNPAGGGERRGELVGYPCLLLRVIILEAAVRVGGCVCTSFFPLFCLLLLIPWGISLS